MFCNILVHASLRIIYDVTEAVQSLEAHGMISRIVEFGNLIRCAVLQFLCDFKDINKRAVWTNSLASALRL